MVLGVIFLHPAFRAINRAAIVAICLVLLGMTSWAQPPASGTTQLPEQLPSALEKGVVKPDAFYLRDTGGNYIFVPNLRYEEFERLLRSQKPLLNPQLPAYQVVAWNVNGEVNAETVNWQVDVEVKLSSAVSGAVSVPLGLADWYLTATPQFEGEGEHLLELVSSTSGYQWWIRGQPESVHKLRLQLISKVASSIDRLSVRAAFPEAPVKVSLLVEGNDVQPELEGQGNEAISSRNLENNRSEITLQSSGGNQGILWRRPGNRVRLNVVESQSNTRIEVAGPNLAWRCKTMFELESTSSNFPSEFMISLPAGAVWQPSAADDTTGYILELLDSDATQAQPQKEIQLRCRVLDERPLNPLEIEVDWNWTPPASSADKKFIIQSPQIQNVDRHDGFIELLYPGNYRVLALANGGTFPVANEGATTAGDLSVARFRFERQPGSIQISLKPEFSETRLRPTYVVDVFRDRLQLRGILDISFAQGQAASIILSPSSWSITEAMQASTGTPLVLQAEADNRLRLDAGGTVSGNTDISRNALWRIDGLREIAADRSLPLEIDIPSLVSEILGDGKGFGDYGAGTLVLIPGDNVLLRQDESLSEGLIADSEIPQTALENIPLERRRRAVSYRFQAAGKAIKWSGIRDLLPQQITIESNSFLNLSPLQASLSQRWKLRIDNEPLKPLRLVVDRSLLVNQGLVAIVNGTAVALQEVPTDPALPIELNENEVLAEFSQIGDLFGDVQISVDTKHTLPGEIGENVNITIPVVQLNLPGKAGVLASSFSLNSTADCEVESVKAATRSRAESTELDWGTTTQGNVIPVESDLKSLDVALKRLTRNEVATARIDRAWLQTAFNTAQRRDRMVFGVSTRESRLSLKLPASLLSNVYDILVDGQRVEYSIDKEQTTVFVDLPKADIETEREYCLELWSEAGRSVAGVPVDVEIPKINGALGPQQFYWELVVPSSEHLVIAPSNLSPEWRWTWYGLGWHRVSDLTQDQLEKWTGASAQSPLPPSVNRYVMSGFGDQPSLRFTALPKPWIWLPVGVGTIALTFLWTSIRFVRNPVFISVMLVLLGILAIYLPDAAMMVIQLLLAAFGLTVVYVLAQWAIGQRVKRRSVFTNYPTATASLPHGGSGVSAKQERSHPSTPLSAEAASPSGTATITAAGNSGVTGGISNTGDAAQ